MDVDAQPDAVDSRAAQSPDDGSAHMQPSGSARVAAAVAALADLEDRPLAEHVEAYQRVHVELQAVLAEIDSA